MNVNPTPLQDQAKLGVVRPGQVEAVNEPLYDFTTYVAAGQAQLTLFNTPRGQSGKTYGDTNMELAGQLPNGIRFEVRDIELHAAPGVAIGNYGAGAAAKFADDVQAIYSGSAWLEFTVLSKVYERVPLTLLPPSTRNNVNAALSDTSTAAANQQSRIEYAAWCGPAFSVTPFLLLPNMNFGVTLNWSAPVALPSGQNARVGIILRGIKYRLSQ